MSIVLKAFWPSAYTEPFHSRFLAYFGALFDHPDIVRRYDTLEIWSLFGSNAIPMPKSEEEDRVLRVQFSGEGYFYKPALYDLSLIPALENAALGIVPHPLAGVHIHTNSLLELLQRPRVWNEANHDARRFCSFVVSNGGPQERKYFFSRLSDFKTVDSCGRFARNWTGGAIPDPDSREYLQFLSKFRFMLCFENNRVDNYMTEKLINAYVGESIPIYWGCPQAAEYLNTDAFLMLDEKASVEGFERLYNQVVALENDKEAYKLMYEQPLFREGATSLPPCMQIEALRDCIFRTLGDKLIMPPEPEPEEPEPEEPEEPEEQELEPEELDPEQKKEQEEALGWRGL